jgi:hypothetical protein
VLFRSGKQRHGPTGTVVLAFEAEVTLWPGVVTVGVFARNKAQVCLLGGADDDDAPGQPLPRGPPPVPVIGGGDNDGVPAPAIDMLTSMDEEATARNTLLLADRPQAAAVSAMARLRREVMKFMGFLELGNNNAAKGL